MLGVVGSLSRDLVDGGPPRPGRRRLLRGSGRCACWALLRAARQVRSGRSRRPRLGAEWLAAAATTTFSFSYDGDARTMSVLEVGDPWRPEEVEGKLPGVEWLHVGGLLRSDFPAETIAALAPGRRALAGRAGRSFAPGRPGPVRPGRRRRPGHPSRGASVLADPVRGRGGRCASRRRRRAGARGHPRLAWLDPPCRRAREHRIEIEPVSGVDPTGAGDAFAVGLRGRAQRGA